MATVNVKSTSTSKGITLNANGKNYSLKYPGKEWDLFNDKEFLQDNLTSLLTINMPIVARKNVVNYDSAKPLFFQKYKTMILRSIPHSTDDYKIGSKKTIQQFKEIKYNFSEGDAKESQFTGELNKKAILPLSFGKDSLLGLAVSQEIGLEPTCVYINDTVSPQENKNKQRLARIAAKKFSVKIIEIRNEIERLNDFETWNAPESCLGYNHMITGFCMISLPLLKQYGAKYIVIGNQRDMDYGFKNKEGIATYPSYDQTTEWQNEQDKMIKKITKNGRVVSIIRPLTNIAIIKILHTRYSDYGKLEHSCDCLDASSEKKWCHSCNKCARLSLFMHAFGLKPSRAGFHRNMLEKKDAKYYSLFVGREVDCYEKNAQARDQQLLGFYLAYKSGVKGYLIDKFRKELYDEAVTREDELYKEFLTAHKCGLPSEINRDVMSIYKEELTK